MVCLELRISTPTDFSFWRTASSHGWCNLAPFFLDRERRLLRRVLRTSKDPALVEISENSDHELHVSIQSHHRLVQKDLGFIRAQVAHVLRLDESLAEFYLALSKAGVNGEFEWIPKARAGRLLRSPSVFEDVVKMICTTNCAWSATKRMIENLVSKLGTPFDGQHSDFPTPEQLAGVTEEFLVREIRSGYRSGYLIELAEKVASGHLGFRHWQNLKEEELFREILSIKGVGPYAAGNLLRLLGHYRHLALDSWCRPRYSQVYRQGRKVSDKTISRHYQKYGNWSGLVMWLDLTREWFEE
jgi:3-methyladenine DNA glycosylase/8-oxoguanine DNA glycosylase